MVRVYGNIYGPTGGQSIPALDYYLAPYVTKSYIKSICKMLDLLYDLKDNSIKDSLKELAKSNKNSLLSQEGDKALRMFISGFDKVDVDKVISKAKGEVEDETYQSMEAFVHNLNSMHSRAGSQVNKVIA